MIKKILTHKKNGNKFISIPKKMEELKGIKFKVIPNIAENKIIISPAQKEEVGEIYIKSNRFIHLHSRIIKFFNVGQKVDIEKKVDDVHIKFL